MLDYKEAKKIAENFALANGYMINRAYEIDKAIMFDYEGDIIYTEGVPFVIEKETGYRFKQFFYCKDHDIAWADWEQLDFETGEPLDRE